MDVEIAKTAGFCMGVRRAVDMAIDTANRQKGPICTYGPLIHNPQVLRLLRDKGIPVLEEIPETGEGTVLIRAHGVPPGIRESLEKAGFHILDATCPKVIRVQKIIRKHKNAGFHVVIAGDADHPEVIGLLGYADNQGHVIHDLSDLEKLPLFEKAIIVAQTTQNVETYAAIRGWAERRAPHYKVFDTICDSTERRQEETRKLAERVDLVLVVGGRASGNTRRLAEVAEEKGTRSLHIESLEEMDEKFLEGVERIGITAGASTPNWILRQVLFFFEERAKNRRGLRGKLKSLQQWLLNTNLYQALGAAAMAYTALVLQNLRGGIAFVAIAFSYILSMLLFNSISSITADRYNNPHRAGMYEKRKGLFVGLAVGTGLAGLFLAFEKGWLPFVFFLLISLAGLLYRVPLLPAFLSGGRTFRLKNIPGSKTFFISLAWAVVCVVLPTFSIRGSADLASLVVFFFVITLIFVRTVFLDILAMQGDRIAGRETLPILIGERRSRILLIRILFLLLAGMALVTLLGLFPPECLLLGLVPLSLFFLLRLDGKKQFPADAPIAFYIESILIMTGFISFLIPVFSGVF